MLGLASEKGRANSCSLIMMLAMARASLLKKNPICHHQEFNKMYGLCGLGCLGTMVFRGIYVKEPLCADSLCLHIDWAQFNWSQQTGRQLVTWELRKPVPGQYACRNIQGQEDPSSKGKLKCQQLMV